MHSPAWHKILSEVWGYKTRSLLVVLSIAVGVLAIGMISGAQNVLSVDLANTYAATNPASAVLYTEPLDDQMIQTIRSMKEVREAEGRRVIAVRVGVGPEQWRDLQLIAVPDFGRIRTDKFASQSGAWPPPDRELLLERSSIDYVLAGVGDTLQIKLPDGRNRTMRVAGLAHDLGQLPPFFSGSAVGYIAVGSLEWLGQTRDLNELHILVAENAYDKPHIAKVSDLVRDKVEKSGRTVFGQWIPDPGKHQADSAIQAMLLLLGTLGALALLLSGFLVTNTISALLAQQVRQIGVMKAIGADTPQIMWLYLRLVLIYSLLALALGIPLGALGAYGLSSFAAGLLNFDLRNLEITPQTLALEIGVGLLVPLVASIYPVASGARITVREALTSYGLHTGSGAPGIIDRLIDQLSNTFRSLSRPLFLAFRNTFRRRGRLALTLVTLTLGGAIFVGIQSVRASTIVTLSDALEYWKYDVQINLNDPYRVEQIEQEALAVPGVAKVESWGTASMRRKRPDGGESRALGMIAPPAETGLLRPTLLQGRWLLPEDENAIVINTDVLKDNPDIQVGDEITLTRDRRDTKWRVVGVVRGVLSSAIAYANYPYFARNIGNVGRASLVVVETQRHDAFSQSDVAKALERRFASAGLRIERTDTMSSMRYRAQSQYDIIIAFLLIMAVLLAIVGGLGLMGTMSMNVLERMREIGVMRAIGASDGAVFMVFLVEGIFTGVMSWAIGVVLAVPLGKLLSDAVGVAFTQAPFTYAFSVQGALLWLVAAILLSAVATFWPSWNASRLSVREVLAYE